MNEIEEQLWDYIDGNCTAVESEEIKAKIATNLQYSKIYKELIAVHKELGQLDFEEPSMSFTRNVMEKVELELPPVALKTKVDQRIVYFIASFFVLSILGIFGYAISKSNLNFTFELPKIDFTLGLTKVFNPITLQIFIIVDVFLGLVYLDSFLRKRKGLKQNEG